MPGSRSKDRVSVFSLDPCLDVEEGHGATVATALEMAMGTRNPKPDGFLPH